MQKSQCWKKIIQPNTNGLVQKTEFNTKITEIGNQTPHVSSFVTTNDFNKTAIDNISKIPVVRGLVKKKTDF